MPRHTMPAPSLTLPTSHSGEQSEFVQRTWCAAVGRTSLWHLAGCSDLLSAHVLQMRCLPDRAQGREGGGGACQGDGPHQLFRVLSLSTIPGCLLLTASHKCASFEWHKSRLFLLSALHMKALCVLRYITTIVMSIDFSVIGDARRTRWHCTLAMISPRILSVWLASGV